MLAETCSFRGEVVKRFRINNVSNDIAKDPDDDIEFESKSKPECASKIIDVNSESVKDLGHAMKHENVERDPKSAQIRRNPPFPRHKPHSLVKLLENLKSS